MIASSDAPLGLTDRVPSHDPSSSAPDDSPASAALVPEGVAGIPDAGGAALAVRAHAMALELEQARGSRELALTDALSGLGSQVQREAGASLALLRVRMGDMLTREGPSSEIARNLVDLRLALLQIDPEAVGRRSLIYRLLGFLPFVGSTPAPLKVLERLSARYGGAAAQVQAIESRLNDGRRLLMRDNIELRQLYEGVEAQQAPLEREARLGEALMGELAALVERSIDPEKQERTRSALHDVTMRVQDLRTMQAVYAQFFVSIEMTRQNNTRLLQSVERTVTMASNVLMVGLAIQMALARQKQVLEATQRTQAFLGQVLASNAAAIQRHTAEIGDIFSNPVIALDKIAQAQRDLADAIATVDRYKAEGIRSARETIARLATLSTEMQGRLAGLRSEPDGERAVPVP